MKFVTSLILAASGIAAPAAATDYSFSKSGILYQVHDTEQAGVRIIEGRDSFGASFSLRVAGGKVSGTYDGNAVDFSAPVSRPREVASR